jgi:small-conductance mechanosensitive channel
MASLFGISHSFSFIFGNSLKEIWENLVYLFTIHAFDVGDIIILADTRYTIKTISLTPCRLYACGQRIFHHTDAEFCRPRIEQHHQIRL